MFLDNIDATIGPHLEAVPGVNYIVDDLFFRSCAPASGRQGRVEVPNNGHKKCAVQTGHLVWFQFGHHSAGSFSSNFHFRPYLSSSLSPENPDRQFPGCSHLYGLKWQGGQD